MFSSLILTCLIIVTIDGVAEGTLEHLIVTYRIPEYSPADCVEGLVVSGRKKENSKLTKVGRTSAFNLGRELAKKYGEDLRNNFWAFSVLSKPAQEAALYLGKGLQDLGVKPRAYNWTEKEMQGVVLEKSESFVKPLNPNKCPGFFQEIKKNSADFENSLQKYSNTLATVMKKYKIQPGQEQLIWVVYEILLKMKASKFPIPTEIKPLMNDLEAISEQILFLAGSTEDLKKLFGGRLLDDIMVDLENKIKEKPIEIPAKFAKEGKNIKASFFAAPQGVVASQVAAFNPKGTTYGGKKLTAHNFYPGQGAVHLVELHKENEKWKVKVLYRRTGFITDTYKPAKFPGCDSDLCDFDTFKKAVKGLRLTEKEQEDLCKAKN